MLTTEPGSPVPGPPPMISSLATTPLAASLLPKLEGLTTGQDPALQMAYVVSALLILTWLCGSGRETTSESTGRRRLSRELGHTRLLDVIVSEAHPPNVMQRDDDDGENTYVASNSFAASGSTGDLDAFAVHAAAASQPNACETGPRSVHHCGQPNSRLPGRPVPSTVPHPAHQSASRAKPQSSQPSACTPANVLHVSPVSCHSLLATTLQPQAVPTTKHEPTSAASPMNVHHASQPPPGVSPASTPTPFASGSDGDRCLPQHRMYHRIYAASQASPPAKARLPFAIGMGIHSLPTPTPLPPPAPLSSCSSCSPLLPLPSKTSEDWVSPPLDPSMSATQMSDIVARRRLQVPGPATTRLWRVPPAESPIVRAYASTLVDGIKMRQTSWW